MKKSLYAEQLRVSADELATAVEHLTFSRDSVNQLDAVQATGDWSPEALEKVEALTSRFARVVD